MTGHSDTFLSPFGAHGMHCFKLWQELVNPFQILLCQCDARITAISCRFRRRQRSSRFPGKGHTVVWVHHQQIMKNRSARTWRADHEYRPFYALLLNLRLLFQQRDKIQPVLQCAHEIRLGDDATE